MDTQKDVQPPKQQPMIYICGAMTAKDCPSLLGFGTTKTFKIPVEHLDFKYIEKCSDVKHLEKILCVLRFDVEKECSKIDEDSKEKTLINNKSHLSKIETRLDTAGLTEKEKDFLATREKEKGNEAFKSGDYEEAVKYYTRSISVLPTVAAYNNRAQAELKLQNWNSAFQDCEKVLELEPGNVKALLRRATTYKHQNKLQDAMEDLRQVLDAEPDNELAKKTLSEVERELKNSAPASKTHTKGKRMVIQEVENSEDENGKESERKHEDGSRDKTTPKSMSLDKATPLVHIRSHLLSKSSGMSYSSLQRCSAAGDLCRPGVITEEWSLLMDFHCVYFNVILGSGSADDLSVLYSNRAACHLKEGNCSGCIEDCNRALELHPFSVKPLLRRAMAYETLEKYQKAYVDYKTVLQIDCGIQIASDSINRITRILMDLDGPRWREKLPPIPSVPTSAQLRVWRPPAETPPDQVGDSYSHHQPGSTDDKMFKTLKEEGNQYVKDKNYKDAISKYSECLQINNKECAIYTNRQVLCNFIALCYLKLCQFEEAKQDCDQALRIDDGNVKACYRRALAHKGLKDYQNSLNDLHTVLRLDSSIVEAKMELEEVTRFLNVKDQAASLNKEKERRKIEIQEVNEGHEELGRTPEEVCTGCPASEGATSRGPPEYYEKLPITKPNNAYEFGQVMNAVSARKDKAACAHLLAITEPKDLPALLSNKLEGDLFLLLIQSLKSELIGKDPSLVYQHLLYLSKAERFKMMLTLISKGQKEQIEQLFDDLSGTPNKHFTLEDVQALKRQYEL
ncbi:Sperm-associated antigen 1 [Myotis brandtii]|uniref:Sperm-associated antigen 1 n=1 Tax=Myotis brandtii TaxID=109478 RepID=S7Q4M6_MYOBR|nr:Sperm-associated antigen 1 [Myotis brandtii]